MVETIVAYLMSKIDRQEGGGKVSGQKRVFLRYKPWTKCLRISRVEKKKALKKGLVGLASEFPNRLKGERTGKNRGGDFAWCRNIIFGRKVGVRNRCRTRGDVYPPVYKLWEISAAKKSKSIRVGQNQFKL